eukprot:GFKZ01012884.1.p1 GENE.GFKZ01012884.1~~GFKZ01012884.1.p1  ORF type:complete len:293 (+),score=28.75 GFKZ01012884.1:309-1187(+)
MVANNAILAFHPTLPPWWSSSSQSYISSPLSSRKPSLHPRQGPLYKPPVVRRPTPRSLTSVGVRCTITSWDSMTASEFKIREATSSLAICFIGMSNCGKSHWSRQLKQHRGYEVVSVDDEIELAIEPELRALGYSGIQGLAEWMGFPCDPQFRQNELVYLTHEEQITGSTEPELGKNCVLDTTGSVIYLKDDTLERVRQQYLVVHLEASDDMLDVMTSSYFEIPKPVVWGDTYRPRDGEEPMEAIRRCYPELLRERRKKFAAMAHVTVPASLSLERGLTVDDFIARICSQLP